MIGITKVRHALNGIACAAMLVTVPVAAQVTTPPTLAPSPTLVLPAVERAVLPNGLTVLVSRNAEVPIVEEQLVIDDRHFGVA